MKTSIKGIGCLGTTIVVLFFLVAAFFIGGHCVKYTVEFWGAYAKGVPIDVPFMPCAIAGIFLSEFAVPLAILTWVLSFVL